MSFEWPSAFTGPSGKYACFLFLKWDVNPQRIHLLPISVCNPEDWTDLSRSGSTRSWPRNGVAPSPFKPGRRAAIRNMLPSGGHRTIRIDIAHTYAIAGWGKDQLVSLLVLCAVRANLWGRAGYEEQLRRAFESFQEWCRVHSKTSTVLDFSKKELKISSLPGLILSHNISNTPCKTAEWIGIQYEVLVIFHGF